LNILLLACPPTPQIEEMMDFGERVTAALGGKVTALCVKSDIAQKFYSPFSIQLGKVDREEEERAFQRISRASGEVKKLRRGGEFVSSVLDEIESGNYDMLIFGDMDKKLTKKLAEYSSIPTLICRKEGDFSKFLVCTDGSEYSNKAVRLAGKIAKATDAEITLLSVAPSEDERDLAQEAIEKARATLSDVSFSDYKAVIEVGGIRDTILGREKEYDMVVLAPKGHGMIHRAIFGHVSLHVLENSRNNVLMVW